MLRLPLYPLFLFSGALGLLLSCQGVEAPVSTPTDYTLPGPHEVDHRVLDFVDAERDQRPVATQLWAPADEPAPRGLVMVSHGSMSMGSLHEFIGEYLASHGYLVAAPDHFGDSLGDPEVGDVYANRVWDLQFLVSEFADDQAPGAWQAAVKQGVASVGHSIGGFNALALCGAAVDADAVSAECADDKDLYCDLQDHAASWSAFPDSRVDTCIGLTPFVHPIYGADGQGAASLDRPVMLLGATEDTILRLDPHLRSFFAASPAPDTLLLEMDGVGHLSFTDLLHDGSLEEHGVVKDLTNIHLGAWLDWRLHGHAAAASRFEPDAIAALEHGETLTLGER